MTTGSAPSAALSASGVAGTAEAGEDLAALWQVPVAKRVAGDERLRGPRAAAQDLEALPEEQLRVLGIRERHEPGIGSKVARRPLPDGPEHLAPSEVAAAARIRAHGGR